MRAEAEESRSHLIPSQGPVIETTLYKIFCTKVFGGYVNRCGKVLIPVATTNAMELISLDFSNLDSASQLLAEAMMRVPELPLLTWLKSSDHLLLAEEILFVEVDEDLAFRELDEAGVTWSFALSAVKATPDIPLSSI